jgi:hypothetical protein
LTRTRGKSIDLKKYKAFYITKRKADWWIVLLNTKRKDLEFSNEKG